MVKEPRSACSECEGLLFPDGGRLLRASDVLIAKKTFQFFPRGLNGIQRASFLDAVFRETIPKLLRFVERYQCVGKVFGFVCNQNVFAILKFRSLYSDRRRYNRYSQTHALIDLTFYARAKPQ